MGEIGKSIVIFGIILVLIGFLIQFSGKIPWIGRLPGDFYYKGDGVQFYFPLTTGILISILLSLLSHLYNYWRGQ